jgi:hypothetical protein
MTLEEQIAALLAEAEPLRGLSEDDPRSAKLGGLVDAINTLRALQAKDASDPVRATVERQLADATALSSQPRKKPGPKPRVEGADA